MTSTRRATLVGVVGVLAALLFAGVAQATALSTVTYTTGLDWRSGTFDRLSLPLGIPLATGQADLRLGATAPGWVQNSTWNTPSQGNSTYTAPALGDLDGDGLLDLIIGKKDGSLVVYANAGTLAGPSWSRQAAWDGPNQGANSYASPTIADLDGDGLNDLLVGHSDQTMWAYRNSGTASAPVWTRTGAWDPPALTGTTHAAPALIDLDTDGDSDLMVGDANDANAVYRNSGTTSSPAWTRETAWDGPHETSRGWTMLAFADLDGDGPCDLLLGDSRGTISVYRNSGTTSVPAWTRSAAWDPPVSSQYAAPAAGNLDDDRDDDLLAGDKGGSVVALRNADAGSVATTGTWTSPAIDSGDAAAYWTIVDWAARASSAGAGVIAVDVRVADSPAALAAASWAPVVDGSQPAPAPLGRYAQARVSFTTTAVLATQVLESLALQTEVDTLAPVTTQTGADGAWHTADVTVTLSASDDVSGVATTEYNVDGTGWTTGTSLVVAATPDGSNDGLHTIEYRSVDNSGRVETTNSASLSIDAVAPATTQYGGGHLWRSTPVTVNLTASDATSGVATTEYRVDGGSWTAGTSLVVPAPSDGSNDGAHTVEYRSVDAAGNVEATRSTTVNIGRVATWMRLIRHRLAALRLSWTPVADATSYDVSIDGALVTTTTGTSWLTRALAAKRGTTITITVVSRDPGGAALQTWSFAQFVR